MPKKQSKTFYVTTRTVVVKRYEVLAPTAKAALVPISTLVECWPCRLMEASTTIDNVVNKRTADRQRRKLFVDSITSLISHSRKIHKRK